MLSQSQVNFLFHRARSSCLRVVHTSTCGNARVGRGAALTGLSFASGSTPSCYRGSYLSPHVMALRFVQYDQTNETAKGINTGNRAMSSRWITKSTKDYMSEADSKTRGAAAVVSQDREDLKQASLERRERFRQVSEETDRAFDAEMDRMREDTDSRWRKMVNFFKRQGKAFTIVYVGAYFGTLLLLYTGFASGLLKKESAFEFMLFFLSYFVDRDKFYKRIEAWGSYVDFGFAFVLNELLEVVRLPLVMFFFFQLRPYLTRINTKVKASIFRFGSVES